MIRTKGIFNVIRTKDLVEFMCFVKLPQTGWSIDEAREYRGEIIARLEELGKLKSEQTEEQND